MKPVSPVIEGLDWITFAKNQPEYVPLPVVVLPNLEMTVISRWKLSWRERIKIFLSGSLWLQQLTFRQPLQPQLPTVFEPKVEQTAHDGYRQRGRSTP